MKKRILSLILGICLVCALFVPASAAARDPYEGFSLANMDAATTTSYRTNNGYLENPGYNQTYTYENVDFGKDGAISVVVETGTTADYAGATVNVYIDSTSNKPIATFVVPASNWGTPYANYCDITTPITGRHNVLLKTGGKATNFFNIRFVKQPSAEDNYVDYAETTGPYIDIAGSAYCKDIVLLWELGLIQEEEDEAMYYPELLVTRGQLLSTLVKCLGEEVSGSGKQVFTDITEDSDLFDAASFAKELGLITGLPDGSFRPDEFILAKDAVSIVCRMLGYDAYAQMRGGYANGYMTVADEYDILDGIDTGHYLTAGAMARLISNAIHAPYFDVSSLLGETAVYEMNEDGILSRYRNIHHDKGLVAANNISGVSQPVPGVQGNYVIINEEEYKAGSSYARVLLGYECDFYYQIKGDEKTILSSHPQDRVKVTELASYTHDIASVTAESIVYYDENGKEQTIDIGNDCYILYNGVAADDALSDLIGTNPFRGRLRFVENKKSKNTLMIEEYQNIIVGGASKSDAYIYDDLEKHKYSFTDEDFVYLQRNNRPAQYADIQKGDVAMMYTSKNKTGSKLVRVFASNATMTGTISVVSDDAVTINGLDYKLAAECQDVPKPGETVTVKLNDMNEIVAIGEAEASSYAIGWMLECADFDTESLSPSSRIRVYDTDNQIHEYTLAANGTIDGVAYRNNASTLQMEMCGAPVRYLLNKDGLVTSMDTILQGAGGEEDALDDYIPKTKLYYSASGRILYSYSTGLTKGIAAPNIKVINKYGDSTDEDDYEWGTSISINEKKYVTGYSFDFSEGSIDVLMVEGSSATRPNTAALVFDRISSAVNEDGDVCDKFYGIEGSKEVTYYLTNDDPELKAKMKALKKGDWVTVNYNRDEIVGLTVYYLYGGEESRTYTYGGEEKELTAALHEGKGISQGKSAWYPDEKYVYATVLERYGDHILVEHKGVNEDGTKNVEYLHLGSNSAVRYLPATGSDKVENGISVGSVMVGDTILIEMLSASTRTIYIVG